MLVFHQSGLEQSSPPLSRWLFLAWNLGPFASWYDGHALSFLLPSCNDNPHLCAPSHAESWDEGDRWPRSSHSSRKCRPGCAAFETCMGWIFNLWVHTSGVFSRPTRGSNVN